jgi:anti-sigma regulatory factor (Ser/Thr protein kinase)
LLCPYDAASLDPEVLDEAARNHPVVVAADDGSRAESPIYRDLASLFDPFDDPLPPPPGSVQELAFDPDSLHRVRQFVYAQAARASVGAVRTSDLALAVHELATNSIRHGGGSGLLRAWQEGDVLLVEVRDAGWVKPPLVGRQRPGGQQEGGRGLWIVNQVCDLVQVRSSSKGTIVRIHMSPA